jgi:hypothetical protein
MRAVALVFILVVLIFGIGVLLRTIILLWLRPRLPASLINALLVRPLVRLLRRWLHLLRLLLDLLRLLFDLLRSRLHWLRCLGSALPVLLLLLLDPLAIAILPGASIVSFLPASLVLYRIAVRGVGPA